MITMGTPQKPEQGREASEAHIAVHWKEEELYQPSEKFIEQANLKDPKVTERFSEKNFPQCFEEYADMLTWDQRWHTVLDTNDPPFWKWFVGGKLMDHKSAADIAVEVAKRDGQEIEKVLIWRRYPGKYGSASPMVKGRDYFIDEALKDFRNKKVEPVSMDAEAPLFLMYTSGSTGKPKGCQHRTGGYLAYVTGTSKYIQDIHPEDVYWCMADIGWITGHSYIVYGPLALAATSVIYEGVPTYPDAGRPWRIAERLDVNIFHTSPTAIRMS